jgi:uncharacterized SAM-binding protein YcdF (DUF218 family)
MTTTYSAPQLSAQEIRDITAFMRVEAPVVKTAIGLALGNSSNPACVAVKTGELFQAGAFDQVIVSGGVQPIGSSPFKSWASKEEFKRWRKEYDLPKLQPTHTEAEYMRQVLIERFDVPARNIIVENRATNTGQNFAFARALGLDNHGSISLINIAPATRRALGNARKHLDKKRLIGSKRPIIAEHGVFPVLGVNWENWAHHNGIRATMLAEFGKIYAENPHQAPYVQQNFCKPVNLADELKRVGCLLTQPANDARRDFFATPLRRLLKIGLSK